MGLREASKIFDTKKIQQLTSLLEKLPENFSDVYIVPEVFPKEAAALFKRLKLPVRAIMDDNQAVKNFLGLPIISTAEAAENFNERTILIVLSEKPVPFIQTTFDIKKWGGLWSVPALVMAPDEVLAVYDRVIVKIIVQLYDEDGISAPHKSLSNLAERFSRGLTTFLDSRFQNFKYQLWDSRLYFKPTYTFNDTAIVIQGPITYDNNYTAETFKLYRSIYPNVPIVVSTWKGEANADFRRECRENSVVLLENDPPEIAGPWNVNMQIKSSFCGVEYVRKNTSAKFVLKTRTDQRINRFDFLVYFKNLLETFPPKGDKLQRRIIFLNSNMTKSFPFYFSDYLSFSNTENVSRLYDVPFHGDSGKITYAYKNLKRLMHLKHMLFYHPVDYNSVTAPSHKLDKFNKMIKRFCSAEDYVAKNFYRNCIASIDENKLLETSWRFIADYILLVDDNSLLLDWNKYESIRYKTRFDFEEDSCAFARWLDMYRNFKINWV